MVIKSPTHWAKAKHFLPVDRHQSSRRREGERERGRKKGLETNGGEKEGMTKKSRKTAQK